MVTAYVVPREGHDVDFDALDTTVRAHLAAYKAPKVWLTVSELPKNTNGKVLKRVLRDTYTG